MVNLKEIAKKVVLATTQNPGELLIPEELKNELFFELHYQKWRKVTDGVFLVNHCGSCDANYHMSLKGYGDYCCKPCWASGRGCPHHSKEGDDEEVNGYMNRIICKSMYQLIFNNFYISGTTKATIVGNDHHLVQMGSGIRSYNYYFEKHGYCWPMGTTMRRTDNECIRNRRYSALI